jgi:NADPH:quinone reductase-like Zn-dependent oxidoreductase
MKAMVNTRYGPPDVLELLDLPIPVPGPDEVLIRVQASTVNRTDCGFLRAKPFVTRFFSGLWKPRYSSLGCEFAGEIAAVGRDVASFRPGERVIGFNDSRFGAHAEYMVLHQDDAIGPMPENLSFEQAAALTEGAHYALCDIRAAGIQAGQRWLVNGATGAIGSAAVQLCKHFGAHVTAVCAPPHLDTIRSLGADVVIDRMAEDFTLSDVRYDVVFDAVGKRSFGECKRILKERGIYVSTELGPYGENPLRGLLAPLIRGKKVIFPVPTITQEDVRFLSGLASKGELRPLIDRTYPLEQAVEAYRYVETGEKIGNVILTL